jgi:hypothetical protein
VFGETLQPLRVKLVGLGYEHVVQVVGEQGEQRIGLQDDSPLASGESRSVKVETRERLSPPALTSSQGSESDDSTVLLIGVVVVLYALVALVLVRILLTLVRRQRRT